MKNLFFALFFLFLSTLTFSGQTEEIVILRTEHGNLEGTLLIAAQNTRPCVALIISGSGPTDRNGNNPTMTNNSLKILADSLVKHGISSLRFDKRGVGNSSLAAINEIDLRFENYINDAAKWLDTLQKDLRFESVIVIGHSEGSLIGMIISNKLAASKFVSISGPGETINTTLREQLKAQPPIVLSQSLQILDSLENGKTFNDVPEYLNPLFRSSVQPYMISWMKYDPKMEISKLNIPVLIIQGTTDIQVSEKNAHLLKKANATAEIKIIEGMNHILKESLLDRQKNLETYNDPDLPLKNELVDEIVKFINE